MYSAWSVIAGEVPTETKWNILGDNDDYFNTSIDVLNDFMVDGWVNPSESWSYSSWDSTKNVGVITVPTDATLKYEVGDKIRLKQGGSYKYFIVGGVTSTTLTLVGGGIYTVTNTSITNNWYSKGVSPVDFDLPTQPIVIYTSTTPTIDLNLSKNIKLDLAGTTTASISNAKIGDIFTIDVVGNGYGLTWFTTLKWIDNVIPALTGSTKIDSYVFKCVATNTYIAMTSGENM